MQLNKLFFPKPKPNYTEVAISLLPNTELIYVTPKQNNSFQTNITFCNCQQPNEAQPRKIPVLLVKYTAKFNELSDKYLLVFHSNAEDIKSCYDFFLPIVFKFGVNIILVEYPGYGIYNSQDPNAEVISEDAHAVYQYFLNKRKIPQTNIIVIGRSMGSGPATLISAQYNPRGLVLISAYSSLRNVCSHFIGSFFSKMIQERFPNYETIKKTTCPLLIIHGQKDDLVPQQHSQQLLSAANSYIKQFHFPPEMTHNKLDYMEDFQIPLENFLKKIEFIEELPIQIEPLRVSNEKKQKSMINLEGSSRTLDISRIRQLNSEKDLKISNFASVSPIKKNSVFKQYQMQQSITQFQD